jgi:hypothetical protein
MKWDKKMMSYIWWLISAIRVFTTRSRQTKSQKLTSSNGRGEERKVAYKRLRGAKFNKNKIRPEGARSEI